MQPSFLFMQADIYFKKILASRDVLAHVALYLHAVCSIIGGKAVGISTHSLYHIHSAVEVILLRYDDDIGISKCPYGVISAL